MKQRLVFALLIVLLAVTACAPQATPTVAPTAAAPTATVPAPTATEVPVTLNVFAASSLKAAFTDIGNAFQASRPSVTVTFNFAGSQQLAQQINSGAPVDVFASANQAQMKVVTDGGRADAAAAKVFAKNRLVVIFPSDSATPLTDLHDLEKSGLKLVLGAKDVPVGQYALNFLDSAATDSSFGADYKTAVLANVVSYEENVADVLTKVALGEADAGIVYLTDISGDNASKVSKLDIPDNLNVIATYPIVALNDSTNASVAADFVAYVLSADGQAIMAKYGFVMVSQ
jgi:molybdate transport system substrate-binding protein